MIDLLVNRVAIRFLIVGRIMLDRGDDALGLGARNPVGGDLAGEVWVFAEVFQILPLTGTRLMFMPGPRIKCTPRARASRPIALP